jgi:hypothetical protein
MTDQKYRASEYVRVIEDDEQVVIETRDEVGRGKRFGTVGEVAMDPGEAEQVAKWILARDLDA